MIRDKEAIIGEFPVADFLVNVNDVLPRGEKEISHTPTEFGKHT